MAFLAFYALFLLEITIACAKLIGCTFPPFVLNDQVFSKTLLFNSIQKLALTYFPSFFTLDMYIYKFKFNF
jgi:hypothetical protein